MTMTYQGKNNGIIRDCTSAVWSHCARFSNGSDFFGLKTSSPGLCKVIIRFDHPWLFAAENTLADFTFQLIKSGTTTKDTFTFVSCVEETGMMLSNTVSPDSAVVEFVVLDDQLDTALPLVMEMINRPSFPEDEFRRIKTLGFENWLISRRQTHVLAREQFMQSLFDGHPYGKIATGEEINAYTLDDVKRIHSQIVQNIHPTIFAASYHPETTARAIEKDVQLFLPVSLSPGPRPETSQYQQKSGTHKGTMGHIPLPDTVQSSIRMGRQLFTRGHHEYIYAKLATTILGGYFSSRLMANLREDKGYTYGVGAGLATLASAGYLTISADVGSEHLNNALEEISREIDKLRNEPVDEDELQTVKQYLRGTALRETDGVFNRLSLYAMLMRQGLEPEWMDSFVAGLELVTSDDILAFSKKWFKNSDFTTITCGETSDESIHFISNNIKLS